MKDYHGCPVQATINVLSGKWKVQAVWHLSFGPRRFAELRDRLPGISEKVLAAQLRELEKDGVVNQDRRAFLSAKGHLLAQPFWRDVDPGPRRPVRLGLEAAWDQT